MQGSQGETKDIPRWKSDNPGCCCNRCDVGQRRSCIKSSSCQYELSSLCSSRDIGQNCSNEKKELGTVSRCFHVALQSMQQQPKGTWMLLQVLEELLWEYHFSLGLQKRMGLGALRATTLSSFQKASLGIELGRHFRTRAYTGTTPAILAPSHVLVSVSAVQAGAKEHI